MADAQLALQDCDFEPDARESARLEALARYEILDTPPEPAFDCIARLIKNIFNTPIAIVSLIDGHRQWYKSGIGLAINEVPLQDTFCRHLMLDSRMLVIPDARLDLRVANNPLVAGDPHIRFYAGAPLTTHDGHTIGTICAIDMRPRDFTGRETEMLADLARLAMETMELRRQAAVDYLTNSLSRRAFMEAARSLFALAQRHKKPLACLTLDLDHFKAINDNFGHSAGDAVLRAVAEMCHKDIRQSDLFGRTGGEEFVILLPLANAADAHAKAERLRRAIEGLTIQAAGRLVPVTASIGVANLEAGTPTLEALIERSDAALYRAKTTGRNRSVSWMAATFAPTEPRRKVLKAGRLSFGKSSFTVECTVRALGSDGASIAVSNPRDLPVRFELSIPADNLRRWCRTTARTETQLDVDFE